MLFYC